MYLDVSRGKERASGKKKRQTLWFFITLLIPANGWAQIQSDAWEWKGEKKKKTKEIVE